jgi:hypothetical protein
MKSFYGGDIEQINTFSKSETTNSLRKGGFKAVNEFLFKI